MVISLDEARNAGLFYEEQFETVKRTIKCWNMFDTNIWYGRLGLFRKIWNSTKNIFNKLIGCTREKSQVDHRIRYIFAELQSGKSGLALLLCVYNYMWSKKNGLEAVNIIGSCSALIRIPQQFKNDLEKIAKVLDCHPDNIVSEKNIVANGSWGKTDSVNIDDTEGKSVLIITDEAHMAAAKSNQFYTHHGKSYETKKENPDKYPNFHILGISATPYDVFFSIQKDEKHNKETLFAFDTMKTAPNHTNIEKLRTNGRLPYYGEKKYSTWDNVPNNRIEALRYELRKAEDYQKCGKFIIILRCGSTELKEYKKEFPHVKFRSYMSDTSPVDTYPVDQLIPDIEKLQNDGKIYCLRIDKSYTEGCRIETDAIHSKVIAVLENERTTHTHTIVQHIGRWCGYNKSHHSFPIYTNNNNDCINEHIKITTRLENCQHNEIYNIIRDTRTNIKTKYSKNNPKAVRRVFEIDKDMNITEDLYNNYYEKTNGHKLNRMTQKTHCPETNLYLRRSSSGYEEDIFFSEFRKFHNGHENIMITTSSVNAEALGGNHYIFNSEERLHNISILKLCLKQVKETWATIKNSSNNALEYKDFNSDETQKYINKMLSISDLEKTKGECCFQKSLLVSERLVDGIKYNLVTKGRRKGMKITEKLINFKKGKQSKYNEKAILQINECIEKNSNKTRIWLIIEVAIILESIHIECAEDMTEFILKNYPQLENDKKLLTVRYHNVDLGKTLEKESILSNEL